MSSTEIASSFIEGAPPGELHEVAAGIKALTADTEPDLVAKLTPAFQKYNETQFVTAKLPGVPQPTLITPYNRLSQSTYYDTQSNTSFTFDHSTQTASSPQPHTVSGTHASLAATLQKALSTHLATYYPGSGAALVAPADDKVHIVVSSLKSSPQNFLSGRWRTDFTYNPATSGLQGTIRVQVHYYEDGNVALNTSKEFAVQSVGPDAVVQTVAKLEKTYQEDLNRALVGLNENAFRGLRRQLPVTRQRIEWERVRGYALGENLKGEAGGKKG